MELVSTSSVYSFCFQISELLSLHMVLCNDNSYTCSIATVVSARCHGNHWSWQLLSCTGGGGHEGVSQFSSVSSPQKRDGYHPTDVGGTVGDSLHTHTLAACLAIPLSMAYIGSGIFYLLSLCVSVNRSGGGLCVVSRDVCGEEEHQ